MEIYSRRLQGKLAKTLCNIFFRVIHEIWSIGFTYVLFLFKISVQERLTKQIAMGISEALQPKGVAVIIEAA